MTPRHTDDTTENDHDDGTPPTGAETETETENGDRPTTDAGHGSPAPDGGRRSDPGSRPQPPADRGAGPPADPAGPSSRRQAYDCSAPDYDALVEYLLDRFDDELRWVASFDTKRYRYEVQYIRDDLKTELTEHQLDLVIHRSIGLFSRPNVEDVYRHLGDVEALVLQHEVATAVHLYLSETDGVVIKLKAGNEVGVPSFVDDCLAVACEGSDPARE